MACDCLMKIQDNLRKSFNDDTIEFDVVINVFGGKNTQQGVYPAIQYNKRVKKKDGSFCKYNKMEKGNIVPTFCCWCGKEY